MAEYVDLNLVCVDCKNPFVFESGEARFFAERGYDTPKRCKACRDIKKAQRNGQSQPQSAQGNEGPVQVFREDPHQRSYKDTWEDDQAPRRRRGRRQ